MEAAKEAVRSFTSRQGHHTDVDEIVNPAVTRETVKPSRHEEFTEAVDREVHQHHYHTTVQPISHREVIPEKHVHNMMPVEKKEFHHGDHDAVKRGVSAELGQFASSSITHETQHTRSTAAAVSGEHVHHHVHETVQPVIHKETIQPEVVHTTVPIHEVHHAEATHHGISALPMKTLDEFTKAGGLLKGSERHTHEEYTGAPRPYNKDLQTTAEKVLSTITGHHGSGHHTTGTGLGSGTHHTTGTALPGTLTNTGTTTNTTTGLGTSGLGSGTHHTTGLGTSGLGSGTHHTTGLGSGTHHTTGLGTDRDTTGLGTTGTGLGSGTHHTSGLGTTGTGLGSGTHHTSGLGTTGTGLGSGTHHTTGLGTDHHTTGLGTTGLGSGTHHTTGTGLGSTERSGLSSTSPLGDTLKGTKRDSGVGERENLRTY